MLVDEPTANLDHLAAEQVVSALGQLVVGRTAVIATHDPLPLRLADDRVALRAGRPVAVGDPATTVAAALRVDVAVSVTGASA
ncbi:Transport ATP-binding protein CydD [Patulibacter medicamentivorans]|uniref:Transport ATP-binding protein CydD n=1 Tax=Patulibacter medicamentivorans TaxID=1097667 RepID=H0E174_9ACTN|nr:Transport ATP-binding protein CydD [Patulibacter medicamentivorans]